MSEYSLASLKYRTNLESLMAHHEWVNQFNALFMIDVDLTRQCQKCHTFAMIPPGEDHPKMGFQGVGIKQSGKDTLRDAILRDRRRIVTALKCSNCGEEQVFETMRIVGAPEILRIKLNINLDFDRKTGIAPKNYNPVKFPQTMDFTTIQKQHLASKSSGRLVYTLSSVLPHNGPTMASGHWVATVRGKQSVFAINDDSCVAHANCFLNTNPQQLHDPPSVGDEWPSTYEAVVLTYVRDHPEVVQLQDTMNYDQEIDNLFK